MNTVHVQAELKMGKCVSQFKCVSLLAKALFKNNVFFA